MSVKQFITQFARDEEGVTAIEYGLIAALIAIVIIGTVTTAGENLSDVFGLVGTKLAAAIQAS